MRKSLLVLFVVCIFGVFSAMAQSTDSSQSSQGSSSSSSGSQSGSMQGSSGSQQSGSSSAQSSGGGNEMVGCLVKEGVAYYIQPDSGGPRSQVTASDTHDLDSHVGQKVKATSSGQSASASSPSSSGSTGSAASNTGSSSSSAGGDNSQTVLVTKVETVATTCPVSSQGGGNTSKPPQ